MGCACAKTPTSSSTGAQQVASTSRTSSVEWEVTYNDGKTARFATEQEATGALAFKGGGMRQVPKGR
jgi:hypothetical protein